jgi:hypothetical protein
MGERRRTVGSRKLEARRAAGRIVPGHPTRETRTMLKVGSDFYILASSLASRRATRVRPTAIVSPCSRPAGIFSNRRSKYSVSFVPTRGT